MSKVCQSGGETGMEDVEGHVGRSEAGDSPSELSESQRERMHRNKEKAKALREARLASAPYELRRKPSPSSGSGHTSHRPADPKPAPSSFRVSHGGYILEEEDDTKQKGGYRRVEEDGTRVLTWPWSPCSFP